jgi:hypothetical protein
VQGEHYTIADISGRGIEAVNPDATVIVIKNMQYFVVWQAVCGGVGFEIPTIPANNTAIGTYPDIAGRTLCDAVSFVGGQSVPHIEMLMQTILALQNA